MAAIAFSYGDDRRRESKLRQLSKIVSNGGKETPAEWALESLAIVRAQVYRLPASGEITATYIESARAVIRTRLAQAGARLAWMLNETLT